MAACASGDKIPHRVLIIGGGISGLSAAEALCKRDDVQVTLLEAMERLGGRAHTDWINDGVEDVKVEMGATWIHGTKGNVLSDFARKNKLLKGKKDKTKKTNPDIEIRNESMGLTDGGDVVSTTDIEDTLGLFFACQNKADSFLLEDSYPKDEPDVGFRTFVMNELEVLLSQCDESERKLKEMILEHRFAWETGVSGCHDMDQISTATFGSYKELEGTHYVIPKGFSALIQAFEKHCSKANILLGQVVKQIRYDENLNNVTDEQKSQEKEQSGSKQVIVDCTDGTLYEADTVILTSSMGFLKEHYKTFFKPDLPQLKEQALNALEIGTVDLMYFQYENLDFLPAKQGSFMFFWDNLKSKDTPMKERWYQKIYGTYVESSYNQNILTFWITGEQAIFVEGLDDDTLVEGITTVLSTMLGKEDIPKPQQIRRSRWWTNEYTRGSYSFIPVGSKPGHIMDLAEPILVGEKPVLCFAGEATHHEFYSTSHGAMLTGKREAQRIADFLDNKAGKADSSGQ